MSTTELNQRIEFAVLNNFLSDWDESLSFCQLLEGIADEDWSKATPWEALEDAGGQNLANVISDLVRDLKRITTEEV